MILVYVMKAFVCVVADVMKAVVANVLINKVNYYFFKFSTS